MCEERSTLGSIETSPQRRFKISTTVFITHSLYIKILCDREQLALQSMDYNKTQAMFRQLFANIIAGETCEGSGVNADMYGSYRLRQPPRLFPQGRTTRCHLVDTERAGHTFSYRSLRQHSLHASRRRHHLFTVGRGARRCSQVLLGLIHCISEDKRHYY